MALCKHCLKTIYIEGDLSKRYRPKTWLHFRDTKFYRSCSHRTGKPPYAEPLEDNSAKLLAMYRQKHTYCRILGNGFDYRCECCILYDQTLEARSKVALGSQVVKRRIKQ